MDSMQVWIKLRRIHDMTPRELYENPEMEALQRESVYTVHQMSKSEMRVSLSHFVREVMLGDDAISRGEGWEEVLSFLDWVDGGME
jgi:hypothetical protein